MFLLTYHVVRDLLSDLKAEALLRLIILLTLEAQRKVLVVKMVVYLSAEN